MRVLAVALLLIIPFSSGAAEPEPERLGVWRAWSAWKLGSGKSLECFVFATPDKSEGKYSRRGEVSVAVTHRPAEQVKAELSFEAGYRFREKAEVKILVDERIFTLFTDGQTAFARDSASDATMVAAMKKGRRLVVRGVSSRGTHTVDGFSLAGFTAAYGAASRACGL